MSLVKHLDWIGSSIVDVVPFDEEATINVQPYDEDKEDLDFVYVGIDFCGAIIELHRRGELPEEVSEEIIDKIKLQRYLNQEFVRHVTKREPS